MRNNNLIKNTRGDLLRVFFLLLFADDICLN